MSLLDIHANITYSLIAPLIGMEPISKYTVAAECPHCGAHAWSIHQDTRNLEEWHYCSQCKVTGSIIAMAAERLEMTEVEAVLYLAEQLEHDVETNAITAYQTSLDYTKKYRKFWEYSRNQMRQPESDQLTLMRHLGWHLRSPMSVERLMSGPAALFGLADPRAANKYLNTASSRLFPLRDTLAVVPFYSTPSKVGGFTCVSQNRETYTHPKTRVSQAKGDSGFAGLQFLGRIQSETIVATSMLKNMIQLQMHHFSSNQAPLPLLSWQRLASSVAQRQWSILDGRSIVLWEREPTASMLHQAMMCNANLSFVGPETRRQQPQEVKGPRWYSWLRHDPAIDIWRRVVRSSRPYEQALKNWARLATPQQKIKLLQDAEQCGENTARLVRSVMSSKVNVKVGCRITVGTSGNSERPGNSIRQTTVIERDGKWYDNQGKVRFPGILRVTHIVVRPGGKQEYVGYLKVDDQKLDFHLPANKAIMPWIKNFGFANGLFLQPEHCTSKIGHTKETKFNPFEAAMRYAEPQVVGGLERIGWDGGGFQFRGARLVDGVFRQNPEFKLPLDAPGPRQNYCRMRKEVKVALRKEGPEMEIVWAMAIALCAQITSPAVELHPCGVWLHRKKCDLFMQTLYNRFEIWRGEYTGWKHRWPRRLDSYQQAIARDESGFFVTSYQTLPAKKIQDLLVVELNDKDMQPRSITHSSDKIVLNYLRHFSKQEHEFPGTWENWKNYTAAQFSEVFDFVDTKALRKAPGRIKVV